MTFHLLSFIKACVLTVPLELSGSETATERQRRKFLSTFWISSQTNDWSQKGLALQQLHSHGDRCWFVIHQQVRRKGRWTGARRRKTEKDGARRWTWRWREINVVKTLPSDTDGSVSVATAEKLIARDFFFFLGWGGEGGQCCPTLPGCALPVGPCVASVCYGGAEGAVNQQLAQYKPGTEVPEWGPPQPHPSPSLSPPPPPPPLPH